jgi:hypothetical protein
MGSPIGFKPNSFSTFRLECSLASQTGFERVFAGLDYGCPQIRAMELAALEEGYRRGPAIGSIGWISLDSDMEWSVAIRTAVCR